jgi:hypothetical protein
LLAALPLFPHDKTFSMKHGRGVYARRAAAHARRRMPVWKEQRNNVPCLLRRWVRGRLHMRQISNWGLRPQSQCRECLLPQNLIARPPSIPCSLLFHAPTILHTLKPMVVSAFRSSLSMRTQLFLRKAAQIQPFLAVPHGSRPSLPRQLSCSTACIGIRQGVCSHRRYPSVAIS